MSQNSEGEHPNRKRRRLTPLPMSALDEEPEHANKMEIHDASSGVSSLFSSKESGASTSVAMKPESSFLEADLLGGRDKESLKRMLTEICAEASPCDEEDLTW